jgi:hypothetical protein
LAIPQPNSICPHPVSSVRWSGKGLAKLPF